MDGAQLDEIAADIFRISLYIPEAGLQFNQFLVRDDEPLLYHTGMRALFPAVRAAVARVLDPARLRWIGFSHFEADECGALNLWLEAAPRAVALCGPVAAAVNIADFADRPPRALAPGEGLATGKYRFHLHPTPHLPHGWDASLLFEAVHRILFCSDLFHQEGDREARLDGGPAELLARARASLAAGEAGPFPGYMPFTARTRGQLEALAGLEPAVLAIMHGSSYAGDCARALRELAGALRESAGAAG